MATLRELLQLQAVISDDDVYMLVPLDKELRYFHTYDLRDKDIFERYRKPPLDAEYKVMQEDGQMRDVEVQYITAPFKYIEHACATVYCKGKVLTDEIHRALNQKDFD